MRDEIKEFMKPNRTAHDGGKPMVFTFTENHLKNSDQNQIDVLKSFMKQFVGRETLPIDLYPLDRLFYTLRKELAARGRVDAVPSVHICADFLSNDPFEITNGISCNVS